MPGKAFCNPISKIQNGITLLNHSGDKKSDLILEMPMNTNVSTGFTNI
jgi:hypothetical protein